VDVGWELRQTLIWNKNSMVFGRQDYHWKHEPCLYGWKSAPRNCGQRPHADHRAGVSNGGRSDLHPTMKAGGADPDQSRTTEGRDVVLDLFGGSGTTLIACEKKGRRARMMERPVLLRRDHSAVARSTRARPPRARATASPSTRCRGGERAGRSCSSGAGGAA